MCGNQIKRRRLISDLMQGSEMERDKSDELYYVKSSVNGEFADRQKNVFAGLAGLEAKHNEFQVKSAKEIEKLEENMREKDAVEFDFPVPSKRPVRRKINPTPSFARNPTKWTKYSLADVDANQLSEKSNTYAALSFLGLMDEDSKKEDEDVINGKKIQFTKKMKKKDEIGEEHKVSFTAGKWKMPEYVVGQEKKKKRDVQLAQKSESNKSKDTKVGLSHLDYDDDDDDEDNAESSDFSEIKQSESSSRKRKRNIRTSDFDESQDE